MVQTGVKLETVGIEEQQSVKDALSSLNGGDVFNEAVAAQYQQAKQQQLAVRLEVQHLHDAVLENIENWETASVLYIHRLISAWCRVKRESLLFFLPKSWERWTGVLGPSRTGLPNSNGSSTKILW